MSASARTTPDPYPADGQRSVGSHNDNDASLLAAAARGDHHAWEAIVDRLQPSVWAATGAHGLNQSEAAQVCTLVWLRLAQRVSSPPEPVRPWLVALVEGEAARIRGLGAAEPAALRDLIPTPYQAR
ncbi:MAG TPA: hypothetical protein VMH41_12115 [Mycobacteriales bacterium]|nr:hypothetical protein [Mycobacteriales bacterium]